MIKIHWTHLAIILAFVIGIFLGSQMQLTPGLALAQDANSNSYPYIAMTIYNNMIFIARGNTLYAMRMIDNPYIKNQKVFLPAGKSDIDIGYGINSTGMRGPAPIAPTSSGANYSPTIKPIK